MKTVGIGTPGESQYQLLITYFVTAHSLMLSGFLSTLSIRLRIKLLLFLSVGRQGNIILDSRLS